MVLGCYFADQGAGRASRRSCARRAASARRPARLWKDASTSASLAEVEMALLTGSVELPHADLVLVRAAARGRGRASRAGSGPRSAGCCSTASCRGRWWPSSASRTTTDEEEGAVASWCFESYRRAGLAETVDVPRPAQGVRLPLRHAGGVSIGIEDLEIPAEKAELLNEADERVERFQRAYKTGKITIGERYNKVIDTWTHANNDVAEAMVNSMRESHAAGSTRCS